MIAARDLIRRCGEADILLTAVGPNLTVKARTGALAPALRSQLQQHKAELLLLLTVYACSECGRFAFNVATTCYWCRAASGREP